MSQGSRDKEQAERFAEAARELDCDESGEAFDRALGKILPPRKPGEPAPHLVEESKPKGSRRRPKSKVKLGRALGS